ncbi:MAG: Glutathione-binding protein GsiB [Firmicutes bacterium]|nr:Glutathione-binding protein GsiB [Bacillota bacterium]
MKKRVAWLLSFALLFVIPTVLLPRVLMGREAKATPLLVAIGGEPISLDPFNVVDHLSPVIQQNIFEGLLTLGDNNQVRPQLAREYSLSPDGRAITFLLREGVEFHDGTSFDAAAVKANFDFLLDPQNEMARRDLFDFVTDIVINSRYSITFKVDRPHYALAYFFAHPQASLKSARELEKRLQDRTYNLTHTAVGTGPFKLRQWYGGRRLELVANENYWNKEAMPRVSGITFLFVREATERVAMLKKGEVEIIYDLTSLEGEELEGEQSLKLLTMPRQGLYYIGLDLQLPHFRDVRVRQAMNYVLDRERLLRALAIAGRPATGPLSPTVFGHHSLAPRDFDLARARELMLAAGQAGGFAVTLHTRDSYIYRVTALEVARQLAAINIKVEVVTHSAGDLFTLLDSESPVDMWVGYSVPHTGEADAQLRADFAPFRPLLDQARSMTELSRALDAYRQVQQTIYNDAHWLFLFYPTIRAAAHSNVRGLHSHPSGVFMLRGAYREADKR